MKKFDSVEEYLEQAPAAARTRMNELRSLIRSAAPKTATERISYGIPSFYYQGALVAYGAFSKHCSFFPMGSSVLEPFEEALKGFRTSKGTVQLPFDKPLPAAVLKKIVKACVVRNEQRAAKAKAPPSARKSSVPRKSLSSKPRPR